MSGEKRRGEERRGEERRGEERKREEHFLTFGKRTSCNTKGNISSELCSLSASFPIKLSLGEVDVHPNDPLTANYTESEHQLNVYTVVNMKKEAQR